MENEFINLTSENITNEHLCCIIRSKILNSGIENKREWLLERLKEGHVFRKLNQKATVFIEYAPLEKAWVPIEGNNFYYIYCLWVLGDFRGKGYGKSLLEYAINDAKENGKSGICMLGSTKQKAWLSNQDFVIKYGFQVVDTTPSGYQLLALSFDGTTPKFMNNAKQQTIDNQNLTIYYDYQCPYIVQFLTSIKEYCSLNNLSLSLIEIDTLEKAKNVPAPFNNFCVFYKGKFQTVNLLTIEALERIIRNN